MTFACLGTLSTCSGTRSFLPAWGHGHFHLLGDRNPICLLGDTTLLCQPARGHGHLLAARDSIPPPVPLGGTSTCPCVCRAGLGPSLGAGGGDGHPGVPVPQPCARPGRAPPVAPSCCPGWAPRTSSPHQHPPLSPRWGTTLGWLLGVLAWLGSTPSPQIWCRAEPGCRSQGWTGSQLRAGLLPVATSSSIPELVGSLVPRAGGDPPLAGACCRATILGTTSPPWGQDPTCGSGDGTSGCGFR